jgi:hypothetical protein
MLYSKESDEIAVSFSTQFLTSSSILVAASVAILNHSLDKMHTIIALSITLSPPCAFLFLEACLSLLSLSKSSDTHGDSPIRWNRLRLTFASLSGILWVVLCIYAIVPSTAAKFSQSSCDGGPAENALFLFGGLPWLMIASADTLGQYAVGVVSITALTSAWLFVWLQNRRHEEFKSTKLHLKPQWILCVVTAVASAATDARAFQ